MAKDQLKSHPIRSILSLLQRHLVSLGIFVVAAMVSTHQYHNYHPSYLASASIHLRTTEGSQLEYAATKISGQRMDPYSQTGLSDLYLKALRSGAFRAFLDKEVAKPKVKSQLVGIKFLERLSAEKLVDTLLHYGYFKKLDRDVIKVMAWAPTRAGGVFLANTLSEAARIAIIDYETRELKDTEHYLEQEIRKSRSKLVSFNEEVDKIQRSQGGLLSSVSASGGNPILERLEQDLEINTSQSMTNEILLRELRKRLGKNRHLASVKSDLRGKNGEKFYKARGFLTESIGSLEREQIRFGAYSIALKERIARHKTVSAGHYRQRLTELKKLLEMEYSFFQLLQTNLFENRVREISGKNRVRDVDFSFIGGVVEKVNLSKKLVYSMVMSMAVGLILMLFWEFLNPLVNSKETIGQLGYGYLGHIPLLTRQSLGHPFSWKGFFQGTTGMIANFNLNSDVSRAFRLLRTRLYSKLPEIAEIAPVLVILSYRSGEGKSTTAENLSACIGHAQHRVLLVDCDFLKASVSQSFGLEKMEGLSEGLFRKKEIMEYVYSTDKPNLSILPAGNSLEFVQSRALHQEFGSLLNRLRQNFDLIVLDTPAYIFHPESINYTQFGDVNVVVAESNGTKVADLIDLFDVLNEHGVLDPTVILTKHSTAFQASTYGYGYGQRLDRLGNTR